MIKIVKGNVVETLEEKFRNMKEGDNVWVESRHGWSVHKFIRSTKTLVVTEDGYGQDVRFNIETGRQKGEDRWSFTYAKPFTKEHQYIVDQHKLYQRANKALKDIDAEIQRNKGQLDKSFVEKLEGL